MYKYIWERVFSEMIGLAMSVYDRCTKVHLSEKVLALYNLKFSSLLSNCMYFNTFLRLSLLYYQAKVEIHTITCKECARFLSTLIRLSLEYSSAFKFCTAYPITQYLEATCDLLRIMMSLTIQYNCNYTKP